MALYIVWIFSISSLLYSACMLRLNSSLFLSILGCLLFFLNRVMAVFRAILYAQVVNLASPRNLGYAFQSCITIYWNKSSWSYWLLVYILQILCTIFWLSYNCLRNSCSIFMYIRFVVWVVIFLGLLHNGLLRYKKTPMRSEPISVFYDNLEFSFFAKLAFFR